MFREWMGKQLGTVPCQCTVWKKHFYSSITIIESLSCRCIYLIIYTVLHKLCVVCLNETPLVHVKI